MRDSRLFARLALILSVIMVCSGLVTTAHPIAADSREVMVYDDKLADGWEDWSWDTIVDLNNSSPVHNGSASVSASYLKPFGGVKVHTNTPVPLADGDSLSFWVNGGTSGQKLRVNFEDADGKEIGKGVPITTIADTWIQFTIAVDLAGKAESISAVYWMEDSGEVQPKFYLDDIRLMRAGLSSPSASSAPRLTVDLTAGRHPISPYIYGMNFADENLIAELRLPVERWGGNATTLYNWKLDTANRASDWFFMNFPEDNPDPSQLPDGSSVDLLVGRDLKAGTGVILTMPLIGWTPKSRDVLCAFSVKKYGPQAETEPNHPDCGNGKKPDGSLITGNDPRDASIPIDPAWVQEWIRHLINQFGTADKGGVLFYNLDNEPELWNFTHRDVHPAPLSYDELRDLTYRYAAAIKEADPAAKTLGPVGWGWDAYFYSALDIAGGDKFWENPLDRKAHGDIPLAEWYLAQMRDYEAAHHLRLLDYFDLHYYPQGQGITMAEAGSTATQQLRLRSTRALWDPAYKDESWIAEPVYLIPRMRYWVARNYPGTKLAISEYNWGGLESINGALAEADVLGIFGREAVDLAAMWAPPTAEMPGAFAFRIYRNYDGKGSAFGDTSVKAFSEDQDRLAVYAAQRPDGTVTIVVINKSDGPLAAPLTIAGKTGGLAHVFRYSAERLDRIVKADDQPVSGGALTLTYPPNSITLLEIKP